MVQAGPFATFSRRYHVEMDLGRYSGHETGRLLCEALLPRLDPLVAVAADDVEVEQLPTWNDPVCRYGCLPGGLYFLSVAPPGQRGPEAAEVGTRQRDDGLCGLGRVGCDSVCGGVEGGCSGACGHRGDRGGAWRFRVWVRGDSLLH